MKASARNSPLTSLCVYLGWVFLACTLVLFCMCMVRPLILLPLINSQSFTEGWVAGHAARLLQGLPLYLPKDSVAINNYPPLFFLLLAAIGKLGGDMIQWGKYIGFAGFLFSGFFIYRIARLMNVSRPAAAFSAFMLWAVIARFFPYFIGVNDPQWLAHALMLGGLWLLLRFKSPPVIIAAIGVMLIAGLFKHNLIAIPVATLAWLFLKDRTRFSVAFPAALGLGGLSLLALHAAFGMAIWQNLFFERTLTFEHFIHKFEHLGSVGVPLFIWLVALYENKKLHSASYTVLINLMLLTGLIELVLFGAGEGVAGNIAFDFYIAAVLALALALEILFKDTNQRRRAARFCFVSLVLFLQLAVWPTFRYLKPAYDAEARQFFYDRDAQVRKTVETLKNVKGQAWCEFATACVLAGKPFIYDRFGVEQRLKMGTLKPEDVLNEFKKQNVRALEFYKDDIRAKNPATYGESFLTPYAPYMKKTISPEDGFGSVLAR